MTGIPSRIGTYPIERELGRGGMGVVYLGRDVRLDRLVAIKVLPEALSRDAERLARFEREARILASLRNTNIAGIYGLEESEGRRFLALEYVEGETLSERLARGPIPIEESLDVCRQIAAGLEAAHEGGVIHRDLKPGNVKITPGGEVKVLDFGLAKGGTGSAPSGTDLEMSLSPTVALAATGVGVILGTAAYMSPEQARGKLVDRRTDIWSFGCVLYECLTGRQLFTGETVSDVLAKILEREPDWAALPPRTPARVRDLLRRCLDKDSKKRLRDIGDARIQLEESMAELRSPGTDAPKVDAARAARTGPLSGVRGVGITLGLTVAGAFAGIAGWNTIGPATGRGEAGFQDVAYLSITVPPSIRLNGMGLLPNGRGIGGVGRLRTRDASGRDAPAMIYTRPLESYEMKPVSGTEGVVDAFPSADGRFLYYVAPAIPGASKFRLSRVASDFSAPPIALGEFKDDWGVAVALHSGDILITLDRGARYMRLPAAGGDPGEPRTIDAGEYRGTLTPASVLPGDRGVLMNGIAYGARGWYYRIALLDVDTGKVRFLLDDGGNAVYAPTGHLLFTRGDVLLAAAFDLDRLVLTGQPVPILNGLWTRFMAEPASFEVATNGTLMYRPGGAVMNERRLAFVDAAGNVTPWTEDRRPYWLPSISRDGRRFSTVITNAQAIDEIWVSDLDRPGLRRVASVPDADCGRAALSPDGQTVAFVRTGRDDKDGLYLKPVDGQGEARLIIKPASPSSGLVADGWSPDGSVFLSSVTESGRTHIRIQRDPRLTGPPEEPRPLISGFVDEFQPVFSPDGRMIAFGSNESGKAEVYVSAYRPDGTVGDPVRVSSGGGDTPNWTAGGKKLLYVAEPRRLMSVAITGSPTIAAGAPVQVADLERLLIGDFKVLPDGRLFGVLTSEQESNDVTEEHVVLGFFELLKRRMSGMGGSSGS